MKMNELTQLFESKNSEQIKDLLTETFNELNQQDKEELIGAFKVALESTTSHKIVDRYSLIQQATALTHYPVRDDENIKWDEPLFDSDGFPNVLVSLGAREVVTRCSVAYVIWDRKTGVCKNADAQDLSISNTPMAPEEKRRREEVALQILNELRQKQLTLTDWIQVGNCQMRCVADTDTNDIGNRVAFIDKSALVRILPFTTNAEDNSKWLHGPKGIATLDAGEQARAWCDSKLVQRGFQFPESPDVIGRTVYPRPRN